MSVVAALAAALTPPWMTPAGAQGQCERSQILKPVSAGEADYFGTVAIHGTHAVVGASADENSSLNNVGAAYLYEYAGGSWVFRQEILPNSPQDGEFFTKSVSIETRRFVGASPEFDESRGRAQVFLRNPDAPAGAQWSHEATLVPNGGQVDDFFGGGPSHAQGISIDGNIVIGGARKADLPLKMDAGKVYLFKRNTSSGVWAQVDVSPGTPQVDPLTGGADAEFEGYFGASVAVSGSRIAVGAPGHKLTSPTRLDAGRVYVYDLDADGVPGAAVTIDMGSEGVADDGFGRSVALDRDNLIVGGEAGFAAVFRHNGSAWVKEATLEVTNGELFGWSTAISGSLAVVGDVNVDHPDSAFDDQGGAFLFRRNTSGAWVHNMTLLADDTDYANPGGQFGHSVAIHGDTAFIGSIRDEDPPPVDVANQGAFYLFRGLPSCP
jgi:hypothetical protein